MKTSVIILLGILILTCAGPARGAEELSALMDTGRLEEVANHNPAAAAKVYEAVVNEIDSRRQLAATAIFRLGGCYRQLGRTNDAVACYERIVREYSDQAGLADQSQRQLAVLQGGSKHVETSTANPAASAAPATSGTVIFVGPAMRGRVGIPPGVIKTLSEAVLELPADNYANLKKVEVERYDPVTKVTTTIKVDVYSILFKKQREKDIALKDGDRVKIPERTFIFQ